MMYINDGICSRRSGKRLRSRDSLSATDRRLAILLGRGLINAPPDVRYQE
jgi:hypothetical protein